jgi:NADPH-dependent glutamate synthase beta subunit-like oxidoreductase/NAD(P)H-flavin reductase
MQIELGFGIVYKDFKNPSGLKKLDGVFLGFLQEKSKDLYSRLHEYRVGLIVEPKDLSLFLIELAKYLELFLFQLFQQTNNLENHYENARLITRCKRNFVQRLALRKYKSAQEIGDFSVADFLKGIKSDNFELEFAKEVMRLLDVGDKQQLDIYEKYAAYAYYNKVNEESILFTAPKKYQNDDYIEICRDAQDNEIIGNKIRHRYGFSLTDSGGNFDQIIDHANYCIYCHNQSKDSCSKGLFNKTDEFKVSDNGSLLTGCPLEEKISEMNYLKYHGHTIAALAVAMIDNPMIAATGHRICNDCMKSCIYQKQEPVNIPEIETRVLKDVLNMPWGFELYDLLTVWNPLAKDSFIVRESTGNRILIVGLGPSGFTLAHYLSKEGHEVVAIDGLKIEAFDNDLKQPIYDVNKLFEDLDTRDADGFGGVAEYGITNRWNKNYLKLIRIILERRNNVLIKGGVRFGSNITVEQAKELGFDHIAICCGAGKPNLLDIKNIMVRGVRSASDFLMSLQLNGASKKNSIANLQIRLPILVVGGGLTAIDAATEALAYYPIQVEKFLDRYEQIGHKLQLNKEEDEIAKEFIEHALLIREELKKEKPNIPKLLNVLGGVKVLYRKSLKDSPAYRNNHEEVEKALEEGIRFVEYVTPKEIVLDNYEHIKQLVTDYKGQEIIFPAKSLIIAAGTLPNTSLSSEFPSVLKKDGKYFQMLDDTGNRVIAEKSAKPKEKYCYTHIEENFSISFLGDAHPSYAGNVVKAMASAKNSYPIISKLLPSSVKKDQDICYVDRQLTAKVVAVNLLTTNIIEVLVSSPLAAKNFEPGQFYKLQNLKKNEISDGLVMEPMAMTGASCDKEKGLISLIILEMGGSSSLCRYLTKGEEIVLMGPTGEATQLQGANDIILVGGGLGNAVLYSIGQKARKNKARVIYFAGYKSSSDLFKREEIEKAADIVIWCAEKGVINVTRDSDHFFQGNIIEAIRTYSDIMSGRFSEIKLGIVIGSDGMMNAVNNLFKAELKAKFASEFSAIASINSPMQCMMKEICAQCLQKHIDPLTGKESYVYSCVNQDQCMELVDFTHLSARLKQSSLFEKLTAKWIEEKITSLVN